MATAIQPRLGPAQVTADTFALQAFRTTADELRRLPPQWRGAVVHRLPGALTVAEATASMGNSAPTLDPHDTFLAFSGERF